jgi:uncharacterized protein
MSNLLQHVNASGFPYPDRIVHLFVGGSELHGAKVHGTDDLDIYGVYIEPPEIALGLESFPHFVWSTAENSRRNTAKDADLTLYSLKKWSGLACKGNPTALHFLFSQGVIRNPIWSAVIAQREVFLSCRCAKHFIGFADDQLKRLAGLKGRGKKGQRTHLESKFGYDTKAGMHALRLLYECQELLRDHTITFPRPERDFLIRVRTGKYPFDRVIAMSQKLMQTCKELESHSTLPQKVDLHAVSTLLADCYRKSWEKTSG